MRAYFPVQVLVVLSLAASAAQGKTTSPSSAPASSPSAEVVKLRSLTELAGAYIEVVRTAEGFKKTARCSPEDQLIIEAPTQGLSMRWSGSPQARLYDDAHIAQDRVTLRERRRTIHIERISSEVLRITFERRNKSRSYLYGLLSFAGTLPQASKDEEDCAF